MSFFRRKQRTPAERFRMAVVNAVILIALELLLKHWMGSGDVVSVLFAAGPAAPFVKVVLAVCFVLIRFIVWVILPGVMARELFLYLTRERAAPC